MNYSFENAKQEWSRPPVDDVGYIPSADLMLLPDRELLALIKQMEHVRYTGWRNADNKWREYLGLDSTQHKTVLDFGCGVGIESLQFARHGNAIVLADISGDNLALAARVLDLHGYDVSQYLIKDKWPFIDRGQVDIFYANGVLHHIPYAKEIIKRATGIATEIRLMLYSDRGWLKYVDEPVPPVDQDVRTNPQFPKFVRVFDQVGTYADWYNREKLEYSFGDLVNIDFCEYITDDDRYLVTVMSPK